MKKTKQYCFIALIIFLSSFGANAAKGNDDRKSQRNPNLTEPMYEILGMLDEYISRIGFENGQVPNVIEFFGRNEENLIDRFEELLVSHANILIIKKDWRKEIGKQGDVKFFSSSWSKIINSFYKKVEKRVATLDPAIFNDASQNEMLRFLQGVYARFGLEDKSSAILMANASYKIETIAEVLKKLGCTNIVIFVLRRLPALYQVQFNPTPLVKENLHIESIVLEFKNSKFNLPDWEVYKVVN